MTADHGLVIIDKPAGLTSHDVVARTRRLAATKKVGHAGTLDPMATGVLVLGVGRATRLLTYLVGADKEYTATIRLGESTLTDDAEGEVTATPGALLRAEGEEMVAGSHPFLTLEALYEAVAALSGPIEQVPSAVSAIKVGGQRSYARVRAGEDVELSARPVTIHRFEVLGEPRPSEHEGAAVLDLDVIVGCSSGTYIRALARDLGAALGTGGHLTALRRTRVGPYAIGSAHTLAELAEAVGAGADEDPPRGLPVTGLADAISALFPVRRLTDRETATVSFGKSLDPSGPGTQSGSSEPAESGAQPGSGEPADSGAQPEAFDTPTIDDPATIVAALAPDGRAIALLRDEERFGEMRARPVLVFDPA
ncbi:tRNA pseudouridine(55) synthase TruB [Bogoriella caseilytica]|uniref:tRNA pseudouridine(55) synthase TruB n=1 Tax=Bogoriella caseilytica TaxID=56055 RepID=UPI0014730434|nr:tRNA pseudouridine(55) synthase TruB [Bogoriella caseilytica]